MALRRFPTTNGMIDTATKSRTLYYAYQKGYGQKKNKRSS